MSESNVPGRITDTLDGTEWLGFTRIVSNREFPFKAQLLPVAGTVGASQLLMADANKDLSGLRHLTITGNFITGSTTLSEAELGVLDSASSANSGTSKAMITGSSGALTVAGALTPSGGVAAGGGFTASARNWHTGGNPASASSDGTDATPSTTETYYAEVFVPANATLTGVALFNGSDVTGNVTVYLTNSAGTNLAHSASTAGSGTDAYQRIPFTATYAAKGPATYYVVAQYSSATARYNTHVTGNFGAGKDTGTTYGTFPASPTIPTTFTTGLGNIASLY